MYKILIVEDDSGIAEGVATLLTTWGMETRCVSDFRDVTAEFAAFSPHLVLLDISLPFFDGYHWCTELRRTSGVPVIFLSSASDTMNIVMAMNMGGDDFIAKPFDGAVLVAKVQALLRRTYDLAGAVPILECRGAMLNTADGSFVCNGTDVPLTKNEYRILLTLMQNKGHVVSREKLMEMLWKTDSFIDENTLTVNVARLRKKLEAAGLCDLIATRVGEGYFVK